MKLGQLAALAILSALTFSTPGQVLALDQKGHDERVKREQETRTRVDRDNSVQRRQDDIRQQARDGGYEKEYDNAVKQYGGPRTQESVDRSRPKNGPGHTGDNDQPGLTGTEGAR